MGTLQMGTGLGIFISKRNPSLVATFCVLSCGYMVSSFNEVIEHQFDHYMCWGTQLSEGMKGLEDVF